MPFDFRFLFRLLKKSFTAPPDSPARLTPKRIAFLCLFVPLFFLFELFIWAGLLLDEIIYPQYRRIRVRKPLYIVGVPRSGSTFLQRLLAMDKENFTSFLTWEIIFAPSITHRKLFFTLGKIDAALGGYTRKLIEIIDRKACEKMAPFHKTGLFVHEEDYMILGHIASSFSGMFLFPFFEEFHRFGHFDHEMTSVDKKRIMSFYKKCVQRHLYFHGEEKRLLSKNPAFTGNIRTIKETFPDVQIICNVRSPMQMVPSTISFLSFCFHRFSDPPDKYPFIDEEIELLNHYYSYPLECEELFPKESWRFLKYDDLVKNAHLTVMAIYEEFGLSPGTGFEETLLELDEKSKKRETKHSYSLDQFGLTRKRVIEIYSDIFERFGFEKS